MTQIEASAVEDRVISPTVDTILVIEDEDLIRITLKTRLENAGYRVLAAADGAAGLATLEEEFVDLVLLDYKLPDCDGLSILKQIEKRGLGQVTIMMTAYSSIEGVVEAMQAGAYTYVKKPFEFAEILEHVKKGLETTRLRREVERLRLEATASPNGDATPIIGSSQSIKDTLDLIDRVNDAGSSTVLILGESGTGKNLIARRIHETSERRNRPFVTLTCSNFSEHLLESELFGHLKGAFTGATESKRGLIEHADGGTLFLDEIGDMPIGLQAKILRFLEDRTFRRIGSTKEITVDVRIVAATNQDLEGLIENSLFRRDLYFRLNVVPIDVTPLRERPEDIPQLAEMFAAIFAEKFHRSLDGIETDANEALLAYDWPGNVRELRNVIERAMILGKGPYLKLDDLPASINKNFGQRGSKKAEIILGQEGLNLEELEKGLIERALELSEGNQSAAARLLQISRDQIRYRMEKFDIKFKSKK